MPNLLPFDPDGKIVGPQSYYYSDKVERSARIARGVLKALQDLQQKTRIDVVYAHSLWGAPHFLYDEIDAAIVSYIEFPSYRAHGSDPDYPPDLSQRLGDRNTEMLHFHQVLLSDLTIVPSATAKAMFPAELQHRIAVQFEGFDMDTMAHRPDAATVSDGHRFTVGFAARDLSNAKGIDRFIRLVDQLISRGSDARFVAFGDPLASTYGYEQQWVQRRYAQEQPPTRPTSFRDHMLRLYPRAAAIEFPGKLPYDRFVTELGKVDLFLYPLRYGVANWGLMELLGRGRCIIASNHGIASELIEDGVNGLLLPDDDMQWLSAIEALRDDPVRRAALGAAAIERARDHHISVVATKYMHLFSLAIERRAAASAKR